jgi:hypothetical protein
VQIIEVRSEAKPLNRSLDVFLNVVGRVGHFSFRTKDVKSTLRGNCTAPKREPVMKCTERKEALGLTKQLIADIVLLYEVPKQLLIFAILVDNLASKH